MTTELPVRNAELLRRVANQIESEPRLYNQGMFGAWLDMTHDEILEDDEVAPDGSVCGTTRCIAGWAVAFQFPQVTTATPMMDRGQWDESRTFDTNALVDLAIEIRPATFNALRSPRSTFSKDGAAFYVLGMTALGLDLNEAKVLFTGDWCPPNDMTVPEALRALADGASVESVTAQP